MLPSLHPCFLPQEDGKRWTKVNLSISIYDKRKKYERKKNLRSERQGVDKHLKDIYNKIEIIKEYIQWFWVMSNSVARDEERKRIQKRKRRLIKSFKKQKEGKSNVHGMSLKLF